MEHVTKKCPYCGEEILAVAKKCKYCGEWLDAEIQETEKNTLTSAPNCVNLFAFQRKGAADMKLNAMMGMRRADMQMCMGRCLLACGCRPM